MEKFPSRSWGVILQQAWTMFLKDRVVLTPNNASKQGNHTQSGEQQKSGVVRKLCFPYNRRFCKFGSRCKFEHKCGLCGKFGHGAFNCRKAQATGNSAQSTTPNGDGKEKTKA